MSVSPVAAVTPRDVVRVTGADAASFLQGQISQDLDALEPGSSAWSLVLAPQGKLDAWFRITRRAEGSFVVDLDAGFAPALVARLERFRMRVDATFEVLDGWRMLSLRTAGTAGRDLHEFNADEGNADAVIADAVIADEVKANEVIANEVNADEGNVGEGNVGAVNADGLKADELNADEVDAEVRAEVRWTGYEGVDLIGPALEAPAGLALDPDRLEVQRIRAGWPAMGRELTERTIPAEIGGLVETSVSFTKGCYTGQELVARIDSRGGNVPRRLRLLVLGDAACPEPGTAISSDGRAVGEITSVALDAERGVTVALGTVHRRVEPAATVQVDGRDARVHPTPADRTS